MSKDIFHVISPIYWMGKWTGAISYSICGPPKCKYVTTSKIYLVVTSICQIFLAILSLWSFFTVLPEFYSISSILMFLAFILALLFDHLFYFADIINKIAYRKTVRKVLANLYRSDMELRRLGFKVSYAAMRRWCLFFFLFCLVNSAYNITTYLLAFKNGSYLHTLYAVCALYINVSQAISVAIYYGIIFIIKNMFEAVTVLLARNFLWKINDKGFRQSTNVRTLERLMDNYQSLTDTLRRFNKTISWQMLFLIGLDFADITMQLLGVVIQILYYKDTFAIIKGIVSILVKNLVRLQIILDIAHRCKQEVFTVRRRYLF